MAIRITYFVHGTTTDNEKDLATGWLPGELSKKGRQQAVDLGDLVNEKFDAIFCSDLKRAVDSAYLGFGGKYEIKEDSRLRECNYGDWNGVPATQFKDNLEKYIDEPFPNGESYKDVEKRIADFLEFLKKNYAGKKVAIVAHQAPQLTLEVLLNNKTWEQAIAEDWRKTKSWQPGWVYELE